MRTGHKLQLIEWPHVKMPKFIAEINVYNLAQKRFCSLTNFPVHDNCVGVNFYITPVFKLYYIKIRSKLTSLLLSIRLHLSLSH